MARSQMPTIHAPGGALVMLSRKTSMPRRAFFALACSCVLLSAAACGSGSDTAGTSTSGTSTSGGGAGGPSGSVTFDGETRAVDGATSQAILLPNDFAIHLAIPNGDSWAYLDMSLGMLRPAGTYPCGGVA